MSDDFLAQGSSLPAVKLASVGDAVTGKVINARKLEDREMDGEIRRWSNGDPKHVWVFDLDVDGVQQSLWVRGQMVTAIRDAANAAKISSLLGCKLTIKHTALGEPKQKGFNAPKLYKAKLEPGAPAVDADDIW